MGKGNRKECGTMAERLQVMKKKNNLNEQIMPSSPGTQQTRSQQLVPNKPQMNLHPGPQTYSRQNEEEVIPETQTFNASSSRGPAATNSTTNKLVPIKKGRGPAQFPKGWGTGKKIEVTLDKHFRVIGAGVNQYKTGIGCLARIGTKLPLNYVEFNDIPQYLRDMVWEEVEYNTFLPPNAKDVVLAELKDIWRKWKHEIKVKYFLPHENDAEYLSQLPSERIELEQWLELVEYWKDKNVKMMMNGIDPTRLDVWMESRSRANGIDDDDDIRDLHVGNDGPRFKKQKSLVDFFEPIKIGTRVHLFCHGIPKKVVAEGVVVDIIDDEDGIGHSFVNVYIAKIVEPNEKLLKPYSGAKTIGEVVHKCIEWEYAN
ncbi:hypothetical protein MIMGU_mgv11b015324mg, partial [Erythranthe guttata]